MRSSIAFGTIFVYQGNYLKLYSLRNPSFRGKPGNRFTGFLTLTRNPGFFEQLRKNRAEQNCMKFGIYSGIFILMRNLVTRCLCQTGAD